MFTREVESVVCGVDTLAEVDVLKHTASQLEECIVDKERDVQRRVQAVREEEWQKLHKVESERCVKLYHLGTVLVYFQSGGITGSRLRWSILTKCVTPQSGNRISTSIGNSGLC